MLKRAEGHRCEVNTLLKVACSFSTFSEVSVRKLFSENHLQNQKENTDFSQEKF